MAGIGMRSLPGRVRGTPVPDVARRMVEHGCQLSIEEIGQGMIDYVAQKEFERIPWIKGAEDVLVALRDAGVPSMLVTTRRVILRRIWLRRRGRCVRRLRVRRRRC